MTDDLKAMTVPEFAARYAIPVSMVRKEIKRGRLLSFRLGERLLRIPEGAWEDYVRRRQQEARKEREDEWLREGVA